MIASTDLNKLLEVVLVSVCNGIILLVPIYELIKGQPIASASTRRALLVILLLAFGWLNFNNWRKDTASETEKLGLSNELSAIKDQLRNLGYSWDSSKKVFRPDTIVLKENRNITYTEQKYADLHCDLTKFKLYPNEDNRFFTLEVGLSNATPNIAYKLSLDQYAIFETKQILPPLNPADTFVPVNFAPNPESVKGLALVGEYAMDAPFIQSDTVYILVTYRWDNHPPERKMPIRDMYYWTPSDPKGFYPIVYNEKYESLKEFFIKEKIWK